MRRKRRAIMELGLRPNEELIGEAVRRATDFFRGEAIHRVWLVAGAHHQRSKGELHALCRVTLENEGVERIEREEVLVVEAIGADLRERAAFGCVRVHIAKMREVRRIGEIAECGEAVGFDCLIGAGAEAAGDDA